MGGNYPQIQGYEIINKIGSGGMSVLYLAYQKSLDRKVVIKQLLSPSENI